MTPARKKALEWIYENGDVLMSEIKSPDCPLSIQMVQRLRADDLVDYFGKEGIFNLTDAGRCALNGDSK